MKLGMTRLVSGGIVVVLLVVGVFTALALDSDSGRIDVEAVSVMDGNIMLSGLMYRAKSATAEDPSPAIVLAHGISSSKEMMSSIGLELARRGYVALCLDLFGHGKSQGAIVDGQKEPSFGVYAAIQYLKSRPFVNSSAIGLIGHSLGAGAVRAAAFRDSQISALVLIAGGLGNLVDGEQYGILNSTFPRNLLVVVGKYDVLFDLNELTTKELPEAFGTQNVSPTVLYGNFSSQTARKLVVPLTTHLFEIVDPSVISESISWMQGALGESIVQGDPKRQFVYLEREVAIAGALVGLVGLTCILFYPVSRLMKAKSWDDVSNPEKGTSGRWILCAVWGAVNIALFVPMFAVGSVILLPPLIFGASVAWWMLGSGTVGLLLLAKFSGRIIGRKISLKEAVTNSLSKETLVTATTLFLILFLLTTLLTVTLNFNIRIISPIFRDLSSVYRAAVFPMFVPFFLPYFVAEGMYFHKLTNHSTMKLNSYGKLRDYALTISGKIFPFILLLGVQYVIKMTLDVWMLPTFLGFLLEFLWLIVPIFAIASNFSWWLYNKTGNVFPGAFFNALLMSWIASVVFPV